MWIRNDNWSRPTTTVLPTQEPLTLSEVKLHVNIAESDATFDAELVRIVQSVREQWEHDTDSRLLTQTVTVNYDQLLGQIVGMPLRPIQSVTSVEYYDSSDNQQTLSTDVYDVDLQRRALRLRTNESWPTLAVRWDAVTVTYVVGYTSRQQIPAIAKQAMLLMVGYYFDQNRGDNDRPNDMRAYESLVTRFMRESYP
jgi:uncharacterized phiE125 gp8 family phage protein